MSLVSTYVQMDDDRWYKNPVIGQGKQWFICYDDDDPIELVVTAQANGHATRKRERVQELLREQGCEMYPILAKKTKKPYMKNGHMRLFGTNHEFLPAFTTWVWLTRPPICFLLNHDGVSSELPPGDKVFYPHEETIPREFK